MLRYSLIPFLTLESRKHEGRQHVVIALQEEKSSVTAEPMADASPASSTYRFRYLSDDVWVGELDVDTTTKAKEPDAPWGLKRGLDSETIGRHGDLVSDELPGGPLNSEEPAEVETILKRPDSCPQEGVIPAFDAGWHAHETGISRRTVAIITPRSGLEWALLGYDVRANVAEATDKERDGTTATTDSRRTESGSADDGTTKVAPSYPLHLHPQ